MKLILTYLFLVDFLLSDSIILSQAQKPSELDYTKDILEQNLLKPNQVLLIDHRTQLVIGIIEITPEGKILRLPPPKSLKQTKIFTSESINTEVENQKTQLIKPLQSLKKNPKNIQNPESKPLINKHREWNKNQIPFLIQEEIIPRN